MKNNLIRQEVREEKNRKAYENIIISIPTSLSRLTITISLSVAIFIFVIIVVDYERKTNAIGILVPTKGMVNVNAKNTEGVVSEVFVKSGEKVVKGDKLLSVITKRSTTESEDVEQTLLKELHSTEQILSRSIVDTKTLFQLKKESLNEKYKSLQSQLERARARNKITANDFELSKLNITKQKKLLRKKLLSDSDFITENDKHSKTSLAYESSQADIFNIQYLLKENVMAVAQLPLLLNSEISKLQKELSTTRVLIINTKAQRGYTLFAATNGTVTGLKMKPNTSISSNERLMTILPAGDFLQAELYVPMKNIGFVETGQEIKIRYMPFPFQKYGKFKGVITVVTNIDFSSEELPNTLSPMIKEPVYRVIARLEKQSIAAYGKDFKLMPGMILEVDIVLERTSFLNKILDPIFQITGEL